MGVRNRPKASTNRGTNSPKQSVKLLQDPSPSYKYVTGLICAAVLVTAVLWSHQIQDHRTTSVPQEIRDKLCTLGTEVPRFELGPQDNPFELLEGIKCPIVFVSKSKSGWWSDDIWERDSLASALPDNINYDRGLRGSNGDFTYMDNTTALAKDIVSWGMLPEKRHPFTAYKKVNRRKKEEFLKSLWFDKDTESKRKMAPVRMSTPIKSLPRLSERLRTMEWWLRNVEETKFKPTLWLSSSGVCSTAHFDSFSNLYTVVQGRKQLRLAPPSSADNVFVPYPSVHPLARQAQRIFPERSDGRDRFREPATTISEDNMLAVDLDEGDAIYIPTGWIHEVESINASIAVSLTNLPGEYNDFNRWMQDVSFTLPFAVNRPTPEWTYGRLAGSFRIMIATILSELGFDITQRSNPLAVLVIDQYSKAVRQQLAIPALGELQYELGCPTPNFEDKVAAVNGGKLVVKKFKTMRSSLINQYLLPYFEGLISKLGDESATRASDKVSAGLRFVETCWLDHWLHSV